MTQRQSQEFFRIFTIHLSKGFFRDDLDSLADLYQKTGEYEKACECYLKMAEICSSRGFAVEAERMMQ